MIKVVSWCLIGTTLIILHSKEYFAESLIFHLYELERIDLVQLYLCAKKILFSIERLKFNV